MNILYLEDEPSDATLVSRCLQALNHTPKIARNIHEAWDKLAEQPDLIMIDIILGRSRAGFQFARDLRAQGHSQPLIAVTGLTTSQDMEECREIGFDHILNKPFTIPELVDLIQTYARN